MRVLQLRGCGDLLDEALGPEYSGQLGLQHLDGHLALVLQILGQVDGGHPPRPELALDAVAGGEGRLQAGGQVGHGKPRCGVGAGSARIMGSAGAVGR
jgi:hypothetical protein